MIDAQSKLRESIKNSLEQIQDMVVKAKKMCPETCSFSANWETVKIPIDREFSCKSEYTGWVDIDIKLRIKER